MELQLSSPWITFFRKLQELFKNDKDVALSYDFDNNIKLRVINYEKANALKKILPEKKIFGNVTVHITVEYNDISEDKTKEELFTVAFAGNQAFKYAYTFSAGSNPITYAVFEKKVVQYWNDDMSDPHGVSSTLYQDIARDVFDNNMGVIFSTDSDKDNGWIRKYYEKHATPQEVKEWEEYNGKGSYHKMPDGKEDKNYEIFFSRSEKKEITKDDIPF